jgi:YidC/Oxa1 family membrane protein insertase
VIVALQLCIRLFVTYLSFHFSMNQQPQPMDKRSLIGFVLIGIIITAWMMYSSISTRPTDKSKETKQKTESTSADKQNPNPQQSTTQTSTADVNALGKYFSPLAASNERFFTIETDNYIAKISSNGGTIASWKLKHYDKWDKTKVQLIKPYAREFGLEFSSVDGKKIDAKKLQFELVPAVKTAKNNYTRVYGSSTFTLNARLTIAPGSEIVKTMTFRGDSYSFDADIALNNVEQYIVRNYDITWNKGLQYQEENSVDESNTATAMASLNGSIEELDAANYSDEHKTNFTGKIDYIAVRSKYFLAAFQPKTGSPDATIYMEGKLFGAPDKGKYEEYSLAYRVPVRPGKNASHFTVYCGPQEYDRLSDYNLESTINLGWRWLVAPIGEYFMLPIFKFIHTFIPNYGISIIIFSILMKLLLYPLSVQQVKSTQKMQLLAPELQKIRDKYPDDQMTQQQETMKLYSEYGINPAGGCLPLLLQMPILYALWSVLSSNIEIRGAEFFGWITNLSVPDVILHLPFHIPLFEIDKFSGLAIIMGATMFVQQKMTVTDPRQKAMIYMMPIMFTLMFSAFPAGLNLYYLVFNLLGIMQQLYVSKYAKNRLTLEDLKKMPKKESWLQKRMQMAQEIAAAQGRSLPGQPSPKQSNQKPKKK